MLLTCDVFLMSTAVLCRRAEASLRAWYRGANLVKSLKAVTFFRIPSLALNANRRQPSVALFLSRANRGHRWACFSNSFVLAGDLGRRFFTCLWLRFEPQYLVCLSEFVAEAWDPLSSSQTSRLVNLLQALVSDYPTICTESKEVRRLLEAAVLRMRASLDHDIFIPLYPKT